jgi:hypothetical protein
MTLILRHSSVVYAFPAALKTLKTILCREHALLCREANEASVKMFALMKMVRAGVNLLTHEKTSLYSTDDYFLAIYGHIIMVCGERYRVRPATRLGPGRAKRGVHYLIGATRVYRRHTGICVFSHR